MTASSVTARLLLSTSLCLAAFALWLNPAQAQFVCAGSATGAAPVTGAGANATGSPDNFACGQFSDASGTGSGNSAVGAQSSARGNNSFNSASGFLSDADGGFSRNTATGFSAKAFGDGTGFEYARG